MTKLTINEIKKRVVATGSHWFDPDTMRFFGTQVYPTVYQGAGGIYFVTSEDDFNQTTRLYTVRQFHDDSIDTASQRYATKEEAIAKAEKLAGEGKTETCERFKPVTNLEQFADDLKAHCGKTDALKAEQLISLATEHHRLMEDYCNGLKVYDEDGEPLPILVRVRNGIKTLAKAFGCTVKFSGDPRGCTVKLIMPDGFTNDWGKEGYCVPTEVTL